MIGNTNTTFTVTRNRPSTKADPIVVLGFIPGEHHCTVLLQGKTLCSHGIFVPAQGCKRVLPQTASQAT